MLLVVGASVAGGIGATSLTEPPTSEPPLFHSDHNVQFFWRCASPEYSIFLGDPFTLRRQTPCHYCSDEFFNKSNVQVEFDFWGLYIKKFSLCCCVSDRLHETIAVIN